MDKTFELKYSNDGIVILTIDVPNESLNILKAEFSDEILDILEKLQNDKNVKGLIVISNKKNSFIAGADINMLDNCHTKSDVIDIVKKGHHVFSVIETLPFPVVAAIHGPCLGGGLELALACHYRICSDSEITCLGLPEVQLGILPGGGGTQRLPRRVGIINALDMMLTGKKITAYKAKKIGLIDEVVPYAILESSALNMALMGKKRSVNRKYSLLNKFIEGNQFTRNLIFNRAIKTVKHKTKNNYPAPIKIIDCVREGMQKGVDKGYEIEIDAFANLVLSPESKALRHIFWATNEIKKTKLLNLPQINEIKNVIILGSGLMGSGIAAVTAIKAGVPVRIKDISESGLNKALGHIHQLLMKKVNRGDLSLAQKNKLMSYVTTTTKYNGCQHADIVIEAVFEELALKQQMIKDIELYCHDKVVFASNTSSIPIGNIAKLAKRPENVIGLHYFSPVEKMPLAEVVVHGKTSQETIERTVDLAKKQGKIPIIVKDGAGFYVNRILATYMNEAAQLLLEGQSIEYIDSVLIEFGFPIGPFQLLDEVGFDVAAKMMPILENALGNRFSTPKVLDRLLDDDRKGRKNNKGFYLYPTKNKNRKKVVDNSVYALFDIRSKSEICNKDDIIYRCLLPLLNEAVYCLEDGIISSARDGDVGAVYGIGFPPFLGGPFHYIDSIGVKEFVTLFDKYSCQLQEKYQLSNRLQCMLKTNEKFYNK